MKPFLHYSRNEFYVHEECLDITITRDMAEEALTNNSYLPEGKYFYISNNTYFKEAKPIPSNKMKKPVNIVEVPTFPSIFPLQDSSPNTLRTVTLSLQATPDQYKTVLDCVTGNPSSLSSDKVAMALRGMFAVKKRVELVHTFGLAEEVREAFGDNFVVSTNRGVLGKAQPYCVAATIEPDMLIHHKQKFVVEDTLYGVSVGDSFQNEKLDSQTTEYAPESLISPYMTVGLGGEDKLREGVGETQVVAAMTLKTAELGGKAVNVGNFFCKSIIFGYVRTVDDINRVIPYRMAMNFEARNCLIFKGTEEMNIGNFLQTVRGYLNNPETLKFDC